MYFFCCGDKIFAFWFLGIFSDPLFTEVFIDIMMYFLFYFFSSSWLSFHIFNRFHTEYICIAFVQFFACGFCSVFDFFINQCRQPFCHIFKTCLYSLMRKETIVKQFHRLTVETQGLPNLQHLLPVCFQSDRCLSPRVDRDIWSSGSFPVPPFQNSEVLYLFYVLLRLNVWSYAVKYEEQICSDLSICSPRQISLPRDNVK